MTTTTTTTHTTEKEMWYCRFCTANNYTTVTAFTNSLLGKMDKLEQLREIHGELVRVCGNCGEKRRVSE